MKFILIFVAVFVYALAEEELTTEKSDIFVNRRIVGGRVARKNEYPYQVALRMRGGSLAFCGGTIIDNKWVLTAAHCFYNKDGFTKTADQVEVVPGTMTDLSSSFTTRLSVAVTKIIVHGRYDTKYKTNDIAMLKVSGNLIQHEEGTYSEKIEMAKKGSDFAGMPGTVTGYGTLTEGGRASSQLRTVNVQVMSNDKCRVYNTFDEQAMLCAGVAAGGKDSCQGDSGGPLVARQSNGKPVLIGVVSFGGGCARAGEPGVYARVSNYETLIKEIIRRY